MKTMHLWQHARTGRLCWSARSQDPERFTQIPVISEDDLPPDWGEDQYECWRRDSLVINGARFGPDQGKPTSVS